MLKRGSLYRWSLPALLLVAHSACVLSPTAANPIVGMWTWQPVTGACTEVHFYKGNGDAAVWSGGEVLRKSYSIVALEPNHFRVEAAVTESNGAPDCTGHRTPVGASSTVYIRLLNGGGYLTCTTPQTESCMGSAMPRARL